MKKLIAILYLTLLNFVGLQAQTGFVGIVVFDNDTSCTFSPGDSIISDAILQAVDLSGTHYYGNSELSTGAYQIDAPLGTYTISARLPYNNPYFSFCQNNIVQNLTAGYDTLYFFAQPIVFCPLMHVDIGSDGIPDCGITKYQVRCQNLGTVLSSNVVVEVQLDSFTTLFSSSIPGTSIGNNLYTFNVGTLGVGRNFMQIIELDVYVCGNQPGRTHCAKANIYPNTICNNSWAGPMLETTLENFTDSILFRIRNNGLGAMTTAAAVSIVEDDLMYLQPFVGPLSPSQMDSIWVPVKSGSTYRAEIDQDSAMPKIVGGAVAWAALEGANPDSLGFFNTGHYTKFYTDNLSVSEAYDCQESMPQVIYNRKTMQTKGYGNFRYITPNTPLEYQIRFQNITPTFAQVVDIYDTLHQVIDISSLHVGAVSHKNYTLELSGNNVLHIQFPFINLYPNIADSTRSHGFINLHFDQKPGLPLGTVIENRAMIVINNFDTTYTANIFNTIGENFIIFLSNEVIYQPKAQVHIYPNPMSDIANFEVSGIDYEYLELEIYSIAGQLVHRVQNQADTVLQMERNQLPGGFYFYRLLADGQQVDAGKLVLK